MHLASKAFFATTLAAFVAGCSTGGYQGPVVVSEPRQADAVFEAPVVMPEAAIIAVPPVIPAPAPRIPSPRADVLTAGDIDDALNFPAFSRYRDAAARQLRLPKAALDRPVLVQLRGPAGAAAPGVRVTLRKPGADAPFYDGFSGVDGNITIFPTAFGQSRLSTLELRAFPQTVDAVSVTRLRGGTTRHVVNLGFDNSWSPDFLDLVFVVDTTGSMGDELAWLTRDIDQIASAAQAAAPGVDIRYGLVVYKAPADPYVVKSYGFTRDLGQFTRWVGSERSSGGAGGPEVVADALQAAVDLDWRRGKGERLLFQIGDEPPTDAKTRPYFRAAQQAAAAGIQVFGLAASGVDPHLEYLMRQGSVLTGGRYLFLTDDSGVGQSHMEPTVSCYRVTRLSGLMARVLRSELTGRRVEAARSDVIREVGSYQDGRCRN